jgi:hypothetical protein
MKFYNFILPAALASDYFNLDDPNHDVIELAAPSTNSDWLEPFHFYMGEFLTYAENFEEIYDSVQDFKLEFKNFKKTGKFNYNVGDILELKLNNSFIQNKKLNKKFTIEVEIFDPRSNKELTWFDYNMNVTSERNLKTEFQRYEYTGGLVETYV